MPLEHPDNTSLDWLETLGYAITFRRDAWVEVFLIREKERWLGRGSTDQEAMEDVLRAMFPSHAARVLLEQGPAAEAPKLRAVPDEDAPRPPEAPEPDAATEEPTPPISAEGMARALAAASGGMMPDPAVVEAAGPTAEEIGEDATAEWSAPDVDAEADTDTELPAPEVSRPNLPTLKETLRPDEALNELTLIDHLIDSNKPELALMTPERQRLAILAWICHSRSIQASSGNHPVVVDSVTNIARKLTGLSKLWWPGSVTALQLDATPRDVGRELGLPPARRPRVWSEAADASEHRLRWVEERDEDDRRDEYGWADGPWLEPGPVNPQAHLTELVHLVEAVGGSLNEYPQRMPQQLRKASGDDRERYARWMQRARWLRGFVTDFELWGRLMGRLRWLGSQLEGRHETIDQLLDPGYKPSRPWASHLGQDPEAKRKQRLKRSVLQSRPWIGNRPDAEVVVSWLLDAFKVLEAERIAQLVAPMRDVVAHLDPGDIPGANRNKRRRLRQVQKHLATLDDAPEGVELDDELPPDAPDPDLTEHEAPRVDPQQALIEAVRAGTAGKKALFVSNRTDPNLEAALVEAFGFSALDWSEGSTRRLQTVAERVSAGSYELVLGATGFQSHSMDTHLIKACKRSNVPYVRVHRGRVLACALALARELGIEHP